MVSRRGILIGVGTAGITSIAGCLSSPAEFELVRVSHGNDRIRQAGTVSISAEIENIGGELGEATVKTSTGDIEETETVKIDGGETKEVEFVISAQELSLGENQYSVSIEEDNIESSFTIEPNLDSPTRPVETWYSFSKDEKNFEAFANDPELLIHSESPLVDMFEDSEQTDEFQTGSFEAIEIEVSNEPVEKDELEDRIGTLIFIKRDLGVGSTATEILDASNDAEKITEDILAHEVNIVDAVINQNGEESSVKWHVAEEDGDWKVVVSRALE